ncbi:endo-1,4-beta-xylanase xylA, putative (macronuclear) [Tetrahymena thermophila SB210]|uniref:Endo-1,4-beta-xylanase xylA, putative n=1 Tax=Tetrahymena thermophila (strain SB210) TaxID=312017 RepID=I7M9I2_TETTS|nr:endo-1,4-beta-xylanase xylA, putative [Tetrahymena thermophila SB210]EAS01802.3 endo-1,4-beta-xylanase xylA, putative [Tetrahymena thermophila SB210]|eukprot:XP_001022047.3 endo-1,4-beta-xylanase xylA, putative [Tetrahymena thermophila SB210]
MEVDIKLNLPLKQVLSSLENSILKQIQLSENSIDIQSLRDAVAQFQKNVQDQIEQFSQNGSFKTSDGMSQLKDSTTKNFSNNLLTGNNSQQKQIQDSYYHRQLLKRSKNNESESDFYQKSDDNSSNSNDDNDDSEGFSSKYNILSPKDKQYITEFFKRHYDPSKRNKMKLVQACQKRINQSFNSIYSMITYLMKRYKQKNRNRSSQRQLDSNNKQQYQGKQQQQDTSDDIEDEYINTGLNFSLNQEKENDLIDEESINNLITKYEFINEKYDSNNFSRQEYSNSKNYETRQSSNPQKFRENYQSNQNFEQVRNNTNGKSYKMEENQQMLNRQLQSREQNGQSKSNYNDQRDVAYNSYDESFDNDLDQKLSKKYN